MSRLAGEMGEPWISFIHAGRGRYAAAPQRFSGGQPLRTLTRLVTNALGMAVSPTFSYSAITSILRSSPLRVGEQADRRFCWAHYQARGCAQ